jgi:hypothetical protein
MKEAKTSLIKICEVGLLLFQQAYAGPRSIALRAFGFGKERGEASPPGSAAQPHGRFKYASNIRYLPSERSEKLRPFRRSELQLCAAVA